MSLPRNLSNRINALSVIIKVVETIRGHLHSFKFSSKREMVCGVNHCAERASDSLRASNIRKISKVGPRLVTICSWTVVLNDPVGEAHGRAQIFKRKLSNLMDNVNHSERTTSKLAALSRHPIPKLG